MSWKYDRSSDRIRDHLDNMGGVEVEPLSRNCDLETLLTETRCREIRGTHVYVDIPNFSLLVTEAAGRETPLKRLAQSVHVYQREVARIVERAELFDGYHVHFQGTRLHALFFRPYDDAELAAKAVLLQLVLRQFVRDVFNPAFPNVGNFVVTGGAALGDVIGTKNGMRTEQELLFLGAPANYAAKVLGNRGTLTITESVYGVLPESLQGVCAVTDRVGPDGGALYELTPVTAEELSDLCDEFDIGWDVDASAERVAEDIHGTPLSEIIVEGATAKMDLDALSIRRNKLVTAASLFADVDGFTAYIDSAESGEDKEEVLRVFHAIRREMSRVVRLDYDGLHVQFQGDRIQGIFHMPADEPSAIVTRAVEAAVGLQSSMLKTLPLHVPAVKDLSLAIGIDVGDTFASKLGTRGQRDRICIGEAVDRAAAAQERHEGGVIALTPAAYAVLPAALQQHFTKDARTGDWIARELTAEKLERAAKATSYGGGPVGVHSGAAGAFVTGAMDGGRATNPARSFAS
jgi:class 3 adenylate cyclase